MQEETTWKSRLNSSPADLIRFNHKITIGPKSLASICNPGASVEFNEETVWVLIGIGKDEVAHLVMTKNAYDTLSLEEPTIETYKSYAEKYIKKIKEAGKPKK